MSASSLPASPSRPPPAAQTAAVVTLADLAPGTDATVTGLIAPEATPEWAGWLAEIGFLTGERVRLIRRAPFGDPLVVRVGDSTFALHRAEAACVVVAVQPPR